MTNNEKIQQLREQNARLRKQLLKEVNLKQLAGNLYAKWDKRYLFGQLGLDVNSKPIKIVQKAEVDNPQKIITLAKKIAAQDGENGIAIVIFTSNQWNNTETTTKESPAILARVSADGYKVYYDVYNRQGTTRLNQNNIPIRSLNYRTAYIFKTDPEIRTLHHTRVRNAHPTDPLDPSRLASRKQNRRDAATALRATRSKGALAHPDFVEKIRSAVKSAFKMDLVNSPTITQSSSGTTYTVNLNTYAKNQPLLHNMFISLNFEIQFSPEASFNGHYRGIMNLKYIDHQVEAGQFYFGVVYLNPETGFTEILRHRK